MIIAVDISNWFDSKSSSTVSYLLSIIQTLKTTSPVEVIFLTINDNNTQGTLLLPPGKIENVQFRSKGVLAKKWWYAIRLPALIKKYKAEIFITADRPIVTKGLFRQIGVVDTINRLGKKGNAKEYRTNQVDQVIVPSVFLQQQIAGLYPIGKDKLTIMVPGKKENSPALPVATKEAIKESYTQGKSYFVYTGGAAYLNNIIYLLKAFSLFKKRQRSEWKLVLAGDGIDREQRLPALLQNYKYKEDIVLGIGQEEKVQLEWVAAAYALLVPFAWEGNGAYVPEAIAWGVPIVAKGGDALSDLLGDAALYAPGEEPSVLAEQIMLLYKDENLHKRLAEKTLFHRAHFDAASNTEAACRVMTGVQ